MTRPRGLPDTARGAAVAVCLLLVATTACSGAAAAGGTAAAGTGSSAADASGATVTDASTASAGARESAGFAQAVDADRTRITVALRPDGDAVWTVELRVALQDDDARQAFESLRDDVRSNPENFTASYRRRMSGAVNAASNATGREMAVENVSVAARIDEFADDGVLTYEFRWTNFAAVGSERLRAGDAIDGFFLEEGTRLTVRWPESYEAVTVTPEPDESTARRVTWRGGETEFAAGEPRVVVGPGSDRSLLLGALGLLAVLATGAAWLVRSGRVSLPGGSGSDGLTRVGAGGRGEAAGGPATGSAAGGAASGGAAGGATRDGAPAGADESAAADEGSGPDEAAATEGSDDEIPAELLSNEEQVLRLLEANGGRMKQQQVVSELDWTEAKTSQVVTSMHDDDAIEKFRIGRENVLALPGEADL